MKESLRCKSCQSENPPDSRFCSSCGTKFSQESEELSVTETYYTPLTEMEVGSTFANRYHIIEELGRGGMGRVYKTLDKEINEKIAIKILRPEISAEKGTIERFRNELRLARKIRHMNVCQMFDITKERNVYFITMEYVSGEDLKSTLHRVGRLSVGKTLIIARQICKGLAEAHRLGVIHRDLKPHNIMIDRAGDVRIMDFGIARSLKSKGHTETGVMIGTPDYMSPEQDLGDPVDQRSDIYSLGVILYELLTGEVPFKGDTAFSVVLKHKTEPPPDPRKYNDQLSDDIVALILKCLEKDKKKRFQNVEELLQEIINIEKRQPTTDKVVPDRKKSATLPRKGLPKFVLPAVFLLAAILIVAFIFWPDGEQVPLQIDTDPPDAEVFLENGTLDIVSSPVGADVLSKEYTLIPFYTLIIPARPSGSRVKIDGRYKGQTPLTIENWTKQTIRVTIEKRGYSTFDRTITLEPGTNQIDYSLTLAKTTTTTTTKTIPAPTPKTYRLTIKTTPADAELFLDDKLAGRTPVNLEKRSGTYKIQIRKPGYRTATDSIELKANEEREYNLTKLEKIKLSIAVGPAADVYIDGVALGEIPPVAEWEVEEGQHTIEFTSERLGKSYRIQMDVQSGQRWQLRMNMQTGKLIQINVLTNERKEQILQSILNYS
ncbi:MAG: protein kinase [Desulfobacterales bacterium]|nr:protein kinase [Desulfobacterales bacterium]